MSSAPALSGPVVLSLLTALPLPSPAAQELIVAHAPFTSTAALPSGPLNKWLTRLNAAVTAREGAACAIAEDVLVQDVEGYATALHGKGWMAACLGSLGSLSLPLEAVPQFLGLVRALVAVAPYAPTFEREVVQPAMGKLAVTTSKLVERVLESGDWNVMAVVLDVTRELILASPAPFRPAIPAFRNALSPVVLRSPPHDAAPEGIRTSAAETLALLYLCGGKAAAAGAWGSDMKEVLGGLGASVAALAAEAWEEEPPRTAQLPPPASLPTFSVDPVVRANAALAAVEGYTERALALLRLRTARPVPIPLAQIVSSALRLLNLTLHMPVAAHISPAHHAALANALPRLWRSGLILLAATAIATRDHMIPHLSAILESSVFLLEHVPATMPEARLALLKFHSILIGIYPAPTLPVEYTSRLLRFGLGVLGGLLDARPASPAAAAQPAGRKSKKRARGAEDALVGTLEGRTGRGTSKPDADVILAVLALSPALHTAPLLSAALLTFSIRLHLALHLALRYRPTLTSYAAISAALADTLEAAAHLEAAVTARDVRTLLVALLPATSKRNTALNELLHPALPPMGRPLPSLSHLHMFAPESEQERKVRHELGFLLPGETRKRRAGADTDDEDDESDDEAMVVDQVQAAPAAAPAVAPLPVISLAAPMPIPVIAAVQPVLVTQTQVTAVQPLPLAPASVAAPVPVAAAAPVPVVPAAPFMSIPTGTSSAAAAAAAAPVAPTPAAAPAAGGDSDDEPLPDLDSGSEDEDDDDE